jgi:cysteine-rich repeat protein
MLVHFHIGARRLCAEFGGVVRKNEVGRFIAKDAPEPAACPVQTCGNGIVEPSEECDDGNLDDTDNCSNDCGLSASVVACSGLGYDPGLDPGPYSLIDFHSHCVEAAPCAAGTVESLLDGNMVVVTASLQRYAIAAPLGDPIPPGGELYAVQNQTNQQTAAASEQVFFLASLECLSEVPASDPGWPPRAWRTPTSGWRPVLGASRITRARPSAGETPTVRDGWAPTTDLRVGAARLRRA